MIKGCRWVRKRLPAYTYGELGAGGRHRIDEHLTSCHACRTVRADLEYALRCLDDLSEAELPEPPPRLVPTLRGEGRPRRRPPRTALGLGLAALSLFVGVFAWTRFIWEPSVEVVVLDRATPHESLARRLHEARLRGDLPFSLASSVPEELKVWTERELGFRPRFTMLRPHLEHEGIRIHGVSLSDQGPSSLVHLSVGQEAVSLFMRRASGSSLRPSLWTKTIYYRWDSKTGTGALSWTTGSTTYVMVSRDARRAGFGCLVCHTDTRERRAILALQLPSEE